MLSDQIIQFFEQLKPPAGTLPNSINWINPVAHSEVQNTIKTFYTKYYNDANPRTMLLGINPGRLGAGVTGISFTDPINLEMHFGIKNDFQKKHELSSRFVYDVVTNAGGASVFYSKVFISSMCPLGFVKDGININYYDDKALMEQVWAYMKSELLKQLEFNINRDVVYSIGKGLNFKYLKKINEELGAFQEVKALPHPRWVMQYRLKSKQTFIDQYLAEIFR